MKFIYRLPLPSIIGNLYNNAEDHKDNPEEHEGRIRSFPHERGAWSTYIYFPSIYIYIYYYDKIYIIKSNNKEQGSLLIA